jgi:hypothetical protein
MFLSERITRSRRFAHQGRRRSSEIAWTRSEDAVMMNDMERKNMGI